MLGDENTDYLNTGSDPDENPKDSCPSANPKDEDILYPNAKSFEEEMKNQDYIVPNSENKVTQNKKNNLLIDKDLNRDPEKNW